MQTHNTTKGFSLHVCGWCCWNEAVWNLVVLHFGTRRGNWSSVQRVQWKQPSAVSVCCTGMLVQLWLSFTVWLNKSSRKSKLDAFISVEIRKFPVTDAGALSLSASQFQLQTSSNMFLTRPHSTLMELMFLCISTFSKGSDHIFSFGCLTADCLCVYSTLITTAALTTVLYKNPK